MAELIQDQAICIRAVDYSETSQVVTFYGRQHGKFAAMAKGSKRAKSSFGGPIERFAYGAVLASASESAQLATLREFEPRHDIVAGLSRQVQAAYACLLATELLGKLTQDHDGHPRLYDSYLSFLQEVAQRALAPREAQGEIRKEVLVLLVVFQLSLLAEIGLRPVFDRCVNCGFAYQPQWPRVYFSSFSNGLVCRDCEASFLDRVELAKPMVVSLADRRHLLKAPLAQVQAAEGVLIGHFTHLLHHRPRAAKFVLA